jgi:hypothetical protein
MTELLRALEIGGPLLVTLVGEIAKGLQSGRSEEEATREALLLLAAMPDLVPVGPDVERILREAREAT